MFPVLPLTSFRLLIAWVVLVGAMKVDVDSAQSTEGPAVAAVVPVQGLPGSVDLPPRHRNPLPEPTDCTVTRLDSEVELDELLDDGLSPSVPALLPASEPLLLRQIQVRNSSGCSRTTGSPRGVHLRC